MKLLLVAVNAKYIHSNLAVYSLRAYAEKYRDDISIVEFTINNSTEDILKGIYKEQADVIAFSCYIWNIDMIGQVVKELKKVQPEARIWFGGPEVSYHPLECLDNYDALDGIVIGEGEQTFLELTEYYLDKGRELSQIHGLAYKNSAYIRGEKDNALRSSITPARVALSMDELSFPYEDMEVFRNKIIYYESSRGCPYSCSYCLSSIEHGIRLRNIDLVKNELKAFLDYKVAQVKFVDRTFNCNKKHAMAIWQFIKEQDNKITNFHFEITADILDEEEIALLGSLRPGQVQLEIGVQTTNPDTIQAIHRRVDFDKLSVNVGRIKNGHNIHQHLDLIAGLPLEGITEFTKSFNDVYRLKPDQLQLGFLKILKGSLMERESERYGIVYRETPPYELLFTEHLNYEELLLLKGICSMVETYYNSGQFNYSIEYLEHYFASPMQLYRELYDYYEEKGYNEIAHNRLRRFEILLEFYKEKVIKSSEEMENTYVAVFEEILFLDLCLREDIKSRPSFAGAPLDYKKIKALRDTNHIIRAMTRIEYFRWDIFASAKEGKAIGKERYLLFDYSSRDPISNSAKISILD